MSGNRKKIEFTEYLKIAFVTENQFTGKINPLATNRRTDVEWIIMLDATHFHWSQINENPNLLREFDATIFILPKTHPEQINTIRKCQGITTRILMQEGPSNYWLDYPTQIQIEYYNLLQEMDAIFCHNEYDKKYYQSITSKPVYIMPTFINLAFILQNIQHPKKLDNSVFIAGNAGNWYNGVTSALVIRDIPEIKIVGFPTMGRKLPNEEILMSMITNKEVKYVPFCDWSKFAQTLGFFKYAVHMMPTIAAASFQLQCAAMGVACIGNRDVDTQRICFPDLCVKPYDIRRARELLHQLVEDNDFYEMIIQKARKNVEQFSASLSAIQVKQNIQEIIDGTKK